MHEEIDCPQLIVEKSRRKL